MKTLSQFKIQTVVAMMIVIFSFCGNTARGSETPTPPAPPVTTAAPAGSSGSNEALNARSEFDNCLHEERTINKKSPAEAKKFCAPMSEAAVSNNTDDCSSQNSRVDTLQSSAQSAKTELLNAQKAKADATKNARHTYQGAILQQEQAKDDFALAQKAITDELSIKEDAARGKLRKAIAELRKQIIAQGAAVLTANQELRNAEMAVEIAIAGKDAKCREAADAAGDAKEAKIDAKSEQEKAAGAKYNYAATSLAGSTNRKSAKRRADIQEAFISTFKKCMDGGGAGAGLDLAIKTSNLALIAARKSNAEALQVIEDQKKEAQKDMANTEMESADELKALRLSTENKLAAAATAYKKVMDATNLAITQSKEDLKDEAEYADAVIKNVTENAQTISANYQGALAAQSKCAGDMAKPASNDDGDDAPLPTRTKPKAPWTPAPAKAIK